MGSLACAAVLTVWGDRRSAQQNAIQANDLQDQREETKRAQEETIRFLRVIANNFDNLGSAAKNEISQIAHGLSSLEDFKTRYPDPCNKITTAESIENAKLPIVEDLYRAVREEFRLAINVSILQIYS